MSKENEALLCECGSVRFCLRKDGIIECHECSSVVSGVQWGEKKTVTVTLDASKVKKELGI